jgi:hypothetical protein
MTPAEAEANIGAAVVYHPFPGAIEDGIITGVTAAFGLVMVRYHGQAQSKATRPEDLSLRR